MELSQRTCCVHKPVMFHSQHGSSPLIQLLLLDWNQILSQIRQNVTKKEQVYYLLFLQGSVATLFRWSWKILSYFVANLSKTLHINFYQNRSSIVKVTIKKFWWVFYAPQCRSFGQMIMLCFSPCLSCVYMSLFFLFYFVLYLVYD